MARLRETEARRVIAEELAITGWETTSSFTVQPGRRPETEALGWWHEHTPENEKADTARSVAYLRAYIKISGQKLYAGGLFLNRHRLWMDRSIISRLEREGYLQFSGAETTEPYFELTMDGRSLVSQTIVG